MEPKPRLDPEDEGEEERGEEEDGGPACRGGSWSRSLLGAGWWVGKRVAVTGAAVTSAPVVIPPLLALSAVGLAFAVPFGVFFASVAGTDRVMRAILPPQSIQQDGELGESEELEEDQGGGAGTVLKSTEEESAKDGSVEADVERSQLSSEYGLAVEGSPPAAAEQDGDVKAGPSPAEPLEDERLYSDQKVREEIFALRTIMGYKETLHLSSAEELRALYHFIGVEPPDSLKDPLDLIEISGKLRVLKSIVGVK